MSAVLAGAYHRIDPGRKLDLPLVPTARPYNHPLKQEVMEAQTDKVSSLRLSSSKQQSQKLQSRSSDPKARPIVKTL